MLPIPTVYKLYQYGSSVALIGTGDENSTVVQTNSNCSLEKWAATAVCFYKRKYLMNTHISEFYRIEIRKKLNTANKIIKYQIVLFH